MFKKIDHIALIVKDRNKSIKFYEDNFGFEKYYEHDVPAPQVEKIIYLRLGETILELVHIPNGPENSGYHFCLITDNFAEDYERLEKEEIPLEQPAHPTDARSPEEQGWKRAVFKGPDNESIEIRG